ncbi:aquaporin family protein [Streptomyces sp. 3MP-14]|uniref:Aquaporin family protein n=1 Tax=Streptomyces mimosae TaxID=2586635 RepID=A0A5N6A140_9ACTN|nr:MULTISPECIES: MIP/aquaporin family protein [Streptomyces]KAB8162477.1 aquaporin family protein [Streptomyces mimosae]KAB8174303.1 aquaporin family protein [Streptomyces sp. 3MP-14]
MSSSDIFFGEVLGTAVLIVLGGGVVAGTVLKKSKAFEAGWVVVTLGWGMAVLTGAYASTQLSGAHINPAVTLGIAIDTGEWSDVPTYVAGQILGAMLGAVLVWLAYYGHFQAHLLDREEVSGSATPGVRAFDESAERKAERRATQPGEPGPVLGVFATAPEIRNTVQNLATEIIATAVLVIGVLTIGVNDDLALSGTGPLMVALIVLGIGLSLGGPTGYAINPARDLGPRIVHALLPLPNKGGSDWGYSWIPVVGPLIGATIAAVVFNLLF